MSCKGCLNPITARRCLQCQACGGQFHYKCLNMNDEQYGSLSREYKAKWRCPSCVSGTSRDRTTPNTPVRQHQLPLKDNPNMINTTAQNPQVTDITNSPCLSNQSCSNEVTLEKIREIFDQKMDASFATFMSSFRAALKEDMKVMIRDEMSSAVAEIKEELTSTTDFLSSEQAELKVQIAERDKKIKYLESSCENLRGEVQSLNNRVVAVEKLTRSYNIEIQAVPENRNENVMALFKSLCAIINFPVEDHAIHACRRVAKMNVESTRPRNILVTLAAPRLKDSLLSAVQRYNKTHSKQPLNSVDLGISGDTRRIYVTEHLSPECKALHAAARKTAKEKKYKFVWVKYGRVYMRKDEENGSVYIKNMASLHDLI